MVKAIVRKPTKEAVVKTGGKGVPPVVLTPEEEAQAAEFQRSVKAHLDEQQAEKPAKTDHPKRKPGRRSLQIEFSADQVPKIIILGRGQLSKRRLFACRLLQSTMDRLHSMTSGPDYLLVDLAVNRMCDALEKATSTEIIKADDLG